MKLVTDWNALSAAIATLPDDEAGKLFRFVAAYINGEEVAADNSVAWLTFGIVKCSLGHKGGVICISEVIDISPGSLDSSLCFFQPSISHDVLCI